MNLRRAAVLAAALGVFGLAPHAQADPTGDVIVTPAPAPAVPANAPAPAPALPAPALAAPALAAPAPGAPTAPAPPGIRSVLGQVGNPTGGLLGLPDLAANSKTMLLGQNAVPSAPTPNAPVQLPQLNGAIPAYLLPLNVNPAPPGQGTLAPGIGPNADIPGGGRISQLHRLYEMYDAGLLKGALLGQNPPGELPVAKDADEPLVTPVPLPAEAPLLPPG